MPKRMHFARRRKGVTNYRKRLALLKSGLPRAVVRFTNSKVMVQISDFEGKGAVSYTHLTLPTILLV